MNEPGFHEMVKSLAKAYIVREIQPVVGGDLILTFDVSWEEVTPEVLEVYAIKTLQQAIKNSHLNFALALTKYSELAFIGRQAGSGGWEEWIRKSL